VRYTHWSHDMFTPPQTVTDWSRLGFGSEIYGHRGFSPGIPRSLGRREILGSRAILKFLELTNPDICSSRSSSMQSAAYAYAVDPYLFNCGNIKSITLTVPDIFIYIHIIFWRRHLIAYSVHYLCHSKVNLTNCDTAGVVAVCSSSRTLVV
jgi:hypothetical protein